MEDLVVVVEGGEERSKETTPPHCLSVQEIFRVYRTSANGLPEKDAWERLLSFGSNTIVKEKPAGSSLLWRFFCSFKEPLVALLVASSLISFLIGQVVDGLSILAAICFVNLMALWQEHKSEKSLEALSKMAVAKCNVKRGNSIRIIDSESLVAGDLVLLSAGDRVPADLRIINSSQLSLDESLLTGEADPVSKTSITLPLSEAARPISERENIAYMGTTVVVGRGTGVVVGVGQETELGNISQMIQMMESIRTPLQEKMDEIGKGLSFLALVIIAIILLVGFYQERPFFAMLNIGVSLAVAAIPEGLPIVVTITLAVGVTRMTYRHVIVRSLPVVEGLGGTTVICTDKTGTLTKNQMTAEYLVTNDILKIEEIDGWRDPRDKSSPRQYKPIDAHLERTLQASIFCNNAVETREGHYVGQPTEVALLRLLKNFDLPDFRKRYTRLSEDPFTSERKLMSTEYEIGGQRVTFVKGAIERVLSGCTFMFSSQAGRTHLSPEIRLRLMEQAEDLGSKALRVLAIAERTGSEPLTFLGLIGIRDPLKEGVVEAFQKCFSSKIQVIILTGDSKETAEAIASELGVLGGSRCSMSAEELDRIPESLLATEIGRVGVFYRVSPAHKLKIVNSLITANETVAMTGDGVNDAPALKRAHIGVAMGRTGSEVAKEAAQMILLDDNFASIYAAILEGKTIFSNILSFLRYQLTTSLSCLLVVFISSVLDMPAPMNPTQILWINILMDGPPAQSLGMEPLDPDLESAPPRPKSESIFSLHLLTEIFVGVSVMTAGTLALFYLELNDSSHHATIEGDELRARTMAFNTFVLFQIFNAFNCKSHSQTFFRKESTGNYFFWFALLASFLMQMGALYVPFLQLIFQTTPLTSSEVFTSAVVASSVLFVDEMGKLVANRNRRFMVSKERVV